MNKSIYPTTAKNGMCVCVCIYIYIRVQIKIIMVWLKIPPIEILIGISAGRVLNHARADCNFNFYWENRSLAHNEMDSNFY